MTITDALRAAVPVPPAPAYGWPVRRDRVPRTATGSAAPSHSVPAYAAPVDTVDVLVVSDNAIMREGVRSVLDNAPGIVVRADLADGPGVVTAVDAAHPAVVVLTALASTQATIRLIGQITALDPAPRVILLADGVSGPRFCLNVLRAGASGYLIRDVDAGGLVGAVRSVARGGAVLTPKAAQCLLDILVDVDIDRVAEARQALSRLSDREREVLAHVACGMGNTQIARTLFMSEGSVKAYVSRLLAKLECENRVQVATLCRDARIQPRRPVGTPARGSEAPGA
jgi:DNA-binding NarL/FixJ family response regulator